jgi:flagellar biosynthetic protein FlhB
VLIVAVLVASRGVVVAPKKIEPKLSRISPIQNARQKYGIQGLVEFAKATVKLVAISAVLVIALSTEADRVGRYAAMPPRAIGALIERQFWAIMTGLLLIAGAIAAFDFVWQRLDHLRRMRMSHEEVKEENRQTEGDPQMRQERRQRARQIATNRMMHDVPEADVVVTNPTHVAVALKWDRAAGSAPLCIAKGADAIALRIREVAERAGVPVHEDAPTARSIHALVEVGEEIRPEHYRAVAAAILFADRLRERAR